MSNSRAMVPFQMRPAARIRPARRLLSLSAVVLLVGCYDLTLKPYTGGDGGQDEAGSFNATDAPASTGGSTAPGSTGGTTATGGKTGGGGAAGASSVGGAISSGGTGGGNGNAGVPDAPAAIDASAADAVDAPLGGGGGAGGSSGAGGSTGTGGAGGSAGGSGATVVSGGVVSRGGIVSTGGTGAGGTTAVCHEGATECLGNGLQTCTSGQWGAAVACGPRQTCTGLGGPAKCSCNVDPVCTSVGGTCSSASVLANCAQDAQACFYQFSATTCTNGACTGPAGSASCCTNVCTVGTTCLSGTTLQTCAVGANGCTLATTTTCASGACGGPAGSASCCTNACTVGTTCLSSTTLQTCAVGANGCMAYTTMTCTNGACSGPAGSARCCTNACAVGTTCLSSTTLQTCAVGANGCTANSTSTCNATCSGPAGSATCAPCGGAGQICCLQGSACVEGTSCQQGKCLGCFATSSGAVSAGNGHTCALKADHSVWCWGDNRMGQLGSGSLLPNASRPVQASSFTDVKQVQAGYFGDVCVLRDDGSVWCWGSNTDGALGAGLTVPSTTTPVQVTSTNGPLSGVAWLGIECVTLSTSPGLWCWSHPFGFQYDVATRLDYLQGLVEYSGGCCSVSGRGPDGQVYWFDHNVLDAPTPVYKAGGEALGDAVALSGFGSDVHCATVANGTAYCFEVEQGSNPTVADPILADGSGSLFSGIAQIVGYGSTDVNLVLRNDGTLWNFDKNSAPYPVRAFEDSLPDGVVVISLTSWGNQCAIRSDQTIWCWGSGGLGQLGNGTTQDSAVPTMVLMSCP
jgi:Regulator of chromosome condensation (RCC1) repeat